MLRNAVALSAVTGRSVRVENIRGARTKPGLRPQHLTSVRAAAAICGAELTGAHIGSRVIEFRPGELSPNTDWRFDIGTAGSTLLVLQSILPVLSIAYQSSSINLTGGTDVPFAPPFDYFANVFAPALARLGPFVAANIERRGFYPKGGGQMQVNIQPSEAIRSFSWTERGAVKRICGVAYSQGLADYIVDRMRDAAAHTLTSSGYAEIDIEIEVTGKGPSEGCGIVLWTECDNGQCLAGSALGRRGKRAEEVGRDAAHALNREIDSSAAVGTHLGDQLMVWMAMAAGPSEITVPQITDHIRTAAHVAEGLAGARFTLEEATPSRVKCELGRV